jgi:hypothetical protein
MTKFTKTTQTHLYLNFKMDNFFYNNIHIKLFSNIAHQHQLITSAMSTEST